MMLLTYIVSLLWIIVAVADSVAVKDECRQIEFGDALSNSRLSKDHVIRVYHVQNEPNCKVKCFLEPDCVAYNYGNKSEGNLQCELCNKSHLQVPSNHVMVTPGFIFRPVAENPCITNPCPHSFTCQVGFRDQGYRCVSHDVDECTHNLHNCAPNITCVNEYGSFFCKECQDALGMENGGLLDEQITASSELDGNSAAYQGRFNVNESVHGSTVKSGAWVAGTSDQSQWLQVDLFDEESLISRVATQGRNQDVSRDIANSQWVERYKLQYSNDGRDFEYYHEQGKSTAKEFTGNTDENSIVFHVLNPPVRARYIRFRPTAWHQRISMRVELYGCCDSLSVIVCDGQTKEIRCESVSKIRVLWANFGRLHPKTCPHESIRTINCRAPTSLNYVREICQGKTACTLRSNYDFFGGDPCGGTHKYLLVGYKCDD
ncbi:PREDICTED: EGF-like repeat and discoidin I-like domain-containing protein 3 isoform X4 [Acropora digitifera]|uniref:EGF-like repeat and discoidin I-like domain-containing protein 3 isoform X4 n=1 Tax=Acropora digitifera TaxID=70779 RepID=UPI00077AE4D8|nr:PREDICTED: EGF-like repeat and discoidin I-like domain-containing protein 3 isoform X4 [Acropora digitifera]